MQACLAAGVHYLDIGNELPAAAALRAVEEVFLRTVPGAFSPAAAFGADFVLTIPDTTRLDRLPAEAT